MVNEGMRQAAAHWSKLEAEFPNWYSFFIDGIDDDWQWLDDVVTPWLTTNTTEGDYKTTGDPAGFVHTVMFKDKALYDRFHAACIVGSPSFAKRQTPPAP